MTRIGLCSKDLSYEEMERIRKISALERTCEEILNEMFEHNTNNTSDIQIARQYLQTGFMWAKRAISEAQEIECDGV